MLIDCVDGGASVSFMQPLSRDRAVAFWRQVAPASRRAARALLIAEDEHGLCGTVQLVFDLPENQPHRADLSKMLVHRRARRQGLGAALVRAAEATALECGRTLLVLDAVTDGDGSPPLRAPRLGPRRRDPQLRACSRRAASARRRCTTATSVREVGSDGVRWGFDRGRTGVRPGGV